LGSAGGLGAAAGVWGGRPSTSGEAEPGDDRGDAGEEEAGEGVVGGVFKRFGISRLSRLDEGEACGEAPGTGELGVEGDESERSSGEEALREASLCSCSLELCLSFG
jgi:hypothetical protein